MLEVKNSLLIGVIMPFACSERFVQRPSVGIPIRIYAGQSHLFEQTVDFFGIGQLYVFEPVVGIVITGAWLFPIPTNLLSKSIGCLHAALLTAIAIVSVHETEYITPLLVVPLVANNTKASQSFIICAVHGKCQSFWTCKKFGHKKRLSAQVPKLLPCDNAVCSLLTLLLETRTDKTGF